ncbi:MAG: TIGR04442 family protein [Deltaproteobacteria bacterium]|nr:TIGR04442 family protein [Deltaproteobacteria bacterium]
MIHDIRLHGVLSDEIEYFTTIAGDDISHRYFFEENTDPDSGPSIRFFSHGNELILTRRGIRHQGNGGSFCEYMFGGDQPKEDLMRKEVLNRLLMYGAVTSDNGGGIRFLPKHHGFDDYRKIFFEGNAISNYFFFVFFQDIHDFREQQETILRTIGKRLKRSPFVRRGDDLNLIHELLAEMNHPRSLFFLIRVLNKYHQAFYELYSELYLKNKSISDGDAERLQALATHYRINQFDQERMKIDVIYKHRENKRIIDEYKDVLIEGEENQAISNSQRARLIRLRTLCVRNNIPIILPNILDDLLLKNRKVLEADEPKYIQETREVFEGLFIREGNPETLITNEDLEKLLRAKQQATEMQDPTFDGILMDTVRLCDELADTEGDDWPLENFGYIITHFDRYDATYMIINQLAFNEEVDLTIDKLRSLLGHKKAFDETNPDLFHGLFIRTVLQNRYLTRFGRKKIQILDKGLKAIEMGEKTLADVIEEIRNIRDQENFYLKIYERVRKRIREVYTKIHSRQERDAIRKQLFTELMIDLEINKNLLDLLLNQAILNINKEIYYTEKLLPRILREGNHDLRRDFFENSGIDRFTLEELERDYYERNRISPMELSLFQSSSA